MPNDPLLVSFHDSTSLPGYWDPQTSFANFCEIDYAVTFYIAEFINTLTNLAYVYYAFNSPSVLSSKQLRSSSTLHEQSHRHGQLDLHAINLILVGVCSLAYHATLRNIPNILDQISMFFLAAGFVYDLYTFRIGSESLRIGFAAVLVASLSSSIYIVITTGNGDLHSITFAALLVLTGVRIMYLIWKAYLPTVGGDESKNRQSSNFVTKHDLCWSFCTAIVYMVIAFSLWVIDMKFCHELRAMRAKLPLPLAFVLELHGWWHVLTARAAGEYVALVRTLILISRAG